MKKPSLYLLLSGIFLLLDAFYFIGLIGSIALIFLCSSERQKIKATGFYNDYEDDLNKLKWARIISIAHIVLLIIGFIGLLPFILIYIFGNNTFHWH